MVNKTDLNNTHDDDEGGLEGSRIHSGVRVAYPPAVARDSTTWRSVRVLTILFNIYVKNQKDAV